MIQIYHNQRCGKSRNCKLFLEESNQDSELSELLKKLTFTPIELVRQKEKIWIDNFKNKTLTDDQIIQAMVENPILIERPIVINGNKAVIGRDLEKVNSFI
jgi:arsenate reductase